NRDACAAEILCCAPNMPIQRSDLFDNAPTAVRQLFEPIGDKVSRAIISIVPVLASNRVPAFAPLQFASVSSWSRLTRGFPPPYPDCLCPKPEIGRRRDWSICALPHNPAARPGL